jgi:hypothetical protein
MTEAQNLMLLANSNSQEAKAFFEEANWLCISLKTTPISEHQYIINRVGELTKHALSILQKAEMLQRQSINLQRELIAEQKQDYYLPRLSIIE